MARSRSQSGDPRSGLLLYGRHHCLRSWARGMRVLPRYQQAVTDDVRRPVDLLREDSAKLQHLIFDKEGHDFGEANLFFLALSKARNFLALNQKLAVRRPNVSQRSRGMTHNADWFAGGNEGLDQLDGVVVFGEIPHRAMAARIEDRVEVSLPHAVEANGLAEVRFRGRILFEADGEVGAKFRLVALGIEQRSSTLGRCERDLNASILEGVVRSCKLFKPECRASVPTALAGSSRTGRKCRRPSSCHWVR